MTGQLIISKKRSTFDWDEDVFVCLRTGSGKLLCSPILHLVFTKSSSVLFTRVFSRQSTVYCTQNSCRLKLPMNIYHVFIVGGVALQAEENRRMTPDPLSELA